MLQNHWKVLKTITFLDSRSFKKAMKKLSKKGSNKSSKILGKRPWGRQVRFIHRYSRFRPLSKKNKFSRSSRRRPKIIKNRPKWAQEPILLFCQIAGGSIFGLEVPFHHWGSWWRIWHAMGHWPGEFICYIYIYYVSISSYKIAVMAYWAARDQPFILVPFLYHMFWSFFSSIFEGCLIDFLYISK